jgi:hypothetical protein
VTINRQRPAANAALLRRVHREFLEMPGLRLTTSQAQRLWSLEPAACADLLTHLVEKKFLARGRDGQYQRSPRALALLRAKTTV